MLSKELGTNSLKPGLIWGTTVTQKAKKCCLITKPEKVDVTRVIFEGTAIKIATQGQRHLVAALGSREYLEEYVGSNLEDWVRQLVKLAEFAMSQPRVCYAAFWLLACGTNGHIFSEYSLI